MLNDWNTWDILVGKNRVASSDTRNSCYGLRLVLARIQTQATRKKTREVKSNQMKYWNEEKIKSAKYNEVLIQLNDLLKDYYYNSETEICQKTYLLVLII